MSRMRMMKDVHAYIVEKDPETAITASLVKRLICSGIIPSDHVGRKVLVNLDNVDRFLLAPVFEVPRATGIRPIKE